MTMMQVRIMRVRMDELLVAMDVRMWFTGRIGRCVDMPMVLIMPVQMLVSRGLVAMQVNMAFGEMKPNAKDHQTAGDPEKEGHLFV